MVDDLRAGRVPDPKPGVIGKQRSVHNTYFTLPVLFAMISTHYPMTYARPSGWLVLCVLMLAGVLVRQYFVLRHKGHASPLLPGAAVVLLAGLAVAIAPGPVATGAGDVSYAEIRAVLDARCVACHAATPTQPGFAQPPKGIVLETAEQVIQNAPKIAETVGSRYMPIGNLTQMTDDERARVAAWFAQGAKR
jgi:uncharacterized membrane protein